MSTPFTDQTAAAVNSPKASVRAKATFEEAKGAAKPSAAPIFYTVVHTFNEGKAEAWWTMLATLDLAKMTQKWNAMGLHNHAFLPTSPTGKINCLWECKDANFDFQAFIDGPDGPGEGVFVNTCHKVMASGLLPASVFQEGTPVAKPAPSSGSFFWVYHTFKEGAATKFWEMMENMPPEGMAEMTANWNRMGLHNHTFEPCGMEGPAICIWETEKPMSVEAFQAFIDSGDGPGAGEIFDNEVHLVMPGATLPSAKFPALKDTTFATFTPTTKLEAALPILLFQSGYGSNSSGHQPLLQKIADAGYVCVVPDREADTVGGKESVGLLFAGLAEGKPASDYNAMSTDGTHLAAALEWTKTQTEVDGQRIDTTKIAGAGFSMGCVEAIQFAGACAPDVKAVAIISSSSGEMLEKLYCFSQSDLAAKCAAFSFPSLWITSDLDSQKGATEELFGAVASPAQLVVFKDDVLDLSMKLTDETSIWSPAANDMLPGLAQHFALASERGVVSDAPIVAFLDHHLKGAVAAPLAPEASIAEQKTK